MSSVCWALLLLSGIASAGRSAPCPATGVDSRGFAVEGVVEQVEGDDFLVRDPWGNLFLITVPEPHAEMPPIGASVRVVAVNRGEDQLAECVELAAGR